MIRIPKIYLNSFYPISCTKKGKKAVREFSFPPYIDGSCRREPDFQNPHPCITSLCRPSFSQKLDIGDTVIYVTNKKGIGSRKIVSILRVDQIFENHHTAADWYHDNGLQIPNNLMINGSEPFHLSQTHQKMGWEACVRNIGSLQKWDDGYYKRATYHPKVVSCKTIYLELENPITLPDNISGRRLISQNPPILSTFEWDKIRLLLNL